MPLVTLEDYIFVW